MEITSVICDRCGEDIPKVEKTDFFGIKRKYYRFGKISFGEPFNNIDPYYLLGIDLCEKCAAAISMEIMQWRTEALVEAERRRKG
ncbi:MAG: hypothetical protein OSJ43_06580 [Oscillospiraceae bacterium]|nr:hypothetical protein [Oscillospiraceae bacterium]